MRNDVAGFNGRHEPDWGRKVDGVFAQQRCGVCGGRLVAVAGFAALPRVTSDVKPWPAGGALGRCLTCGTARKADDPAWRRECAAIYADYAIYHQSGGEEQAVFDPASGRPMRRSDALAAALTRRAALPAQGRALDVGCGNGAFLAALSRRFDGWSLTGSDLNDRHLPVLQTIPGFDRLLPPGEAAGASTYDLVSLIHSLEHFPEPAAALRDAAAWLRDDGILLAQVPNAAANPFDLLVADHMTHFHAAGLERLGHDCGLEIVALADDWIAKELTLVARKGGAPAAVSPPAAPPPAAPPLAAPPPDWAESGVRWLGRLLAQADALTRNGPIGVFGSSVAATWLFGRMPDRIAFFVDEDPARRDAVLFGRPILTPEQVPAGSVVLAPLAPVVAAAVARRLAGSSWRLATPGEDAGGAF